MPDLTATPLPIRVTAGCECWGAHVGLFISAGRVPTRTRNNGHGTRPVGVVIECGDSGRVAEAEMLRAMLIAAGYTDVTVSLLAPLAVPAKVAGIIPTGSSA